MRVEEWMSPDPMTVRPTASAEAAAALLRSYRVRHLPVVDDDAAVVGMVSDRDLVTGVVGNRSRLAVVTSGGGATETDELVGELMSAPALTATADEPLSVAAHRMLAHRVSALAVVDDDRRLIGVLTSTDCLLALLQAAPADPTVGERHG